MKKLSILLCAVAMTFSLTACGSSSKESAVPASSTVSETPKAEPSAAPEESELSEYDKAKQAILDHVDVAYTGLTSAGAPMYFLASNDGE